MCYGKTQNQNKSKNCFKIKWNVFKLYEKWLENVEIVKDFEKKRISVKRKQ